MSRRRMLPYPLQLRPRNYLAVLCLVVAVTWQKCGSQSIGGPGNPGIWMVVDGERGSDPSENEIEKLGGIEQGWQVAGDFFGNASSPLKRIQTCVDVQLRLCRQRLAASTERNDWDWRSSPSPAWWHVCAVRGGVYHESVTVHGWPGQCALSVQPFDSASVLMKGTVDLTNVTWTSYKDKIVMASLDGEFVSQHPTPFQQLFHGQVMMMEARWPNSRLDDMLSRSSWSKTKEGSVYGKIEDAGLYQAGVDWTGGLATLNVAHQFYTWTRYVATYHSNASSKSASFTYPKDLPGITSWAKRANVTSAWTGQQYFLSGKLEALDSPGEWFLDVSGNSSIPKWTLYFWPPDGAASLSDVQVKVKDLCFNATKNANFHISGVDFFACTFSCRQCTDSTVTSASILYPTYNRLIPEMGPVDVGHDEKRDAGKNDEATTRLEWLDRMVVTAVPKQASLATVFQGERNNVSNVTLQHSNNHGLVISGDSNRVEQVLVRDTCWLGTLLYPPIVASGSNNVITNSTAAYFGNAGITTHGPNHTVAFCHVHDGGLIGLDTAGIYTGSPSDHGAHYHHNWVHDMAEKCIRGDDLSANMTIHHNVMDNCGEPRGDVRQDGVGLIVKGLGHVVYANTIINCKRVSRCMPACGSPYKPWDCHGNSCPLLVVSQNENTLYFNNAQYNQTGEYCGCSGKGDATYAGGHASGVYNGTAAQMKLVNPNEMDYRPSVVSPLVDAGVVKHPYTDGYVGKAPDIGAYEYEGEAWKAGCSINKSC